MSDPLTIIPHKCTYDEYESKFPDNVNVNMAEVLEGTALLSLSLTTTTTATATAHVEPHTGNANQNANQNQNEEAHLIVHNLSGQTHGDHSPHANSNSLPPPVTTVLHLYPRNRMSYDDYDTAFPNNVNINMAEVLEKKSLIAAPVETKAALSKRKKIYIVKKKKKTVLIPAPISAATTATIQSPTQEVRPLPLSPQKSVKSSSSSSVDPRSSAMLRRPPFKNAVHV